jgi:hypothetical protein
MKHRKQLRPIPLCRGRVLVATPVFETYWRFACERQAVFLRRCGQESPPWTTDEIIAHHRFTNVYRASDRVSQYLIRNVIYAGDASPEELFFRTILFKFFNRVETWEALQSEIGQICWSTYDGHMYERTLDALFSRGAKVYSAAYIMPSPAFGAKRKHANHLRLLERMMADSLPHRLSAAPSLKSVYNILLSYPSLGPFLAFQLSIDLNYSPLLNFSEMDYVVAGPGARNGIRKCFADTAGLTDEEVITVVTERASDEFDRLELDFHDLWGRPLHLIDCQNIFCEVDKYARVAHPDVHGENDRVRIKQKFLPYPRPTPQWYPPKWNLSLPRKSGESQEPMARAAQLSLFLR